MSKFLLWQRFRAYTAYTAATFVATLWQLFERKRCNTVAALPPMVRRIFSLKKSVFHFGSGSSVGSFPNSSQEIDDLRESVDFSPSDGDEWHSHGKNDEAAIYGHDEYDANDYDPWEAAFEDMCNDVGWPDDRSWAQQAVDEIIDSERPGDYPATPPDEIRDIPF
jgi:hypothetical protein